MYHWDLPQRLQDMGGWLNPLMVDFMEDYADLLIRLYGDKVRTIIMLYTSWKKRDSLRHSRSSSCIQGQIVDHHKRAIIRFHCVHVQLHGARFKSGRPRIL